VVTSRQEASPLSLDKEPYTVRLLYVIPADRRAWPEARKRATEFLDDTQKWFALEMARYGYGPKTFDVARDTDGLVIFDIVETEEASGAFQEEALKAVGLCKSAAAARNLRANGDHDVVIYICESFRIDEGTGELSGAFARGGVFHGRRECFLSSAHLKLARREWCTSRGPYAGKVIPEISESPLPDVAFRKNSGISRGQPYTLGQLSGKSYGTIAHELGHAFGLTEDNARKDGTDRNRKGYLMGNGFRGMQGYFAPDLTDDFCQVSERNAAVLEGSGRLMVVPKQ